MAKEKILVVEDDEDILALITYNLEKEGYKVSTAASGEDALEQLQDNEPSLVLLDLMLPEMDGLEVCRRLKTNADLKHLPVIMVTAKGEESDVVAGLELGAEDYITKPFRPKEFVARVRSVLRRVSKSTTVERVDTVVFSDLQIHLGRHEVLVNGSAIDLSFTEFEVLYVLAQKPGWVLTRYQIVDAVRGEDYAVTDRSVDVQIVALRKKLGEASRHIETVRGIGYRFVE